MQFGWPLTSNRPPAAAGTQRIRTEEEVDRDGGASPSAELASGPPVVRGARPPPQALAAGAEPSAVATAPLLRPYRNPFEPFVSPAGGTDVPASSAGGDVPVGFVGRRFGPRVLPGLSPAPSDKKQQRNDYAILSGIRRTHIASRNQQARLSGLPYTGRVLGGGSGGSSRLFGAPHATAIGVTAEENGGSVGTAVVAADAATGARVGPTRGDAPAATTASTDAPVVPLPPQDTEGAAKPPLLAPRVTRLQQQPATADDAAARRPWRTSPPAPANRPPRSSPPPATAATGNGGVNHRLQRPPFEARSSRTSSGGERERSRPLPASRGGGDRTGGTVEREDVNDISPEDQAAIAAALRDLEDREAESKAMLADMQRAFMAEALPPRGRPTLVSDYLPQAFYDGDDSDDDNGGGPNAADDDAQLRLALALSMQGDDDGRGGVLVGQRQQALPPHGWMIRDEDDPYLALAIQQGVLDGPNERRDQQPHAARERGVPRQRQRGGEPFRERSELPDMSYEALCELEDVPTPLPAAKLSAIPRWIVDGPGPGGEGAQACPICLCEFEDGEEAALLPDCLHQYHWSCISEWLKKRKTCCVCKKEITGSG